jgi:hypothetical protein
MPEKPKAKLRLEIAHVLFVDIAMSGGSKPRLPQPKHVWRRTAET